MKTQEIIIYAYWMDEPEEVFCANCRIGKWDGITNEDEVFYWFDDVESILGDQGDFFVVRFES